MKKPLILSVLKENRPHFVSGEEIRKKLGVSRTAVWKHISALREEGYSIDAVPRSGYRLVAIPDRLYAEEIMYGLDTEAIGRTVYFYESVDSTNCRAAALASGGAPGGALVVAEEQVGGRGRLGRGWFTPWGMGISCSLVLRPDVNPVEASSITMLTAVAAARAIERVAGISPGIKWPNDLLIGGKKICGILTEMNAEMEKINFLVVGVGINVNIPSDFFPVALKETATSLFMVKNQQVSRLELLKTMLKEFEDCYQIWLKSGFEPLLNEWKERSVVMNRPVRVSTPRESWEGLVEDVDGRGALILRMPDGSLKQFIAGEVSLRT